MLWMDDDAVFTDMEFVFPFADYDAAGVNLVIWGDPQRVYRANDIQACTAPCTCTMHCTMHCTVHCAAMP